MLLRDLLATPQHKRSFGAALPRRIEKEAKVREGKMKCRSLVATYPYFLSVSRALAVDVSGVFGCYRIGSQMIFLCVIGFVPGRSCVRSCIVVGGRVLPMFSRPLLLAVAFCAHGSGDLAHD